ncbi:hypothetical protein [Mycobacterium sp. NAZ190054]|uniref:hypothetical protein n=1 Tax=Mycobacterium sp. NAZ190054 TaxID=1747766 RepID=UPI0012E33743|nr:hypothetical protein [Mycobacterium sp. NAZ190054]
MSVAELGLPPGTVVRLVDNIGSRGIFLGITDEGWWLLGLDVTSGELLFGPVRLGPAGDATAFNCFVNGPPLVLCVRQAPDPAAPSTAWVVDTDSGAKVFDGPTDVQVAAVEGRPRLEQIGDHAIATVTGKGIYGVGSRAELTWFVPGNGIMPTQFTTEDRDTPASTLVVQKGGDLADVVFSAVDGRVVEPELPEGVRLWRAMVYPGGFGYEYTDVAGQDRVAFFDEAGNMLSALDVDGAFEARSIDVPTVSTESNKLVVTLEGRRLLELPPTVPYLDVRLTGSRFLVAADADHEVWQQFDLRTGEAGTTCEDERLKFYYIGSDGEVAVTGGEEGVAQGIDLATCETLWTIPGSGPGEAKEVWKVDTALIQRTDDRLFSLVAPQ